jgi:hypothetical protein
MPAGDAVFRELAVVHGNTLPSRQAPQSGNGTVSGSCTDWIRDLPAWRVELASLEDRRRRREARARLPA